MSSTTGYQSLDTDWATDGEWSSAANTFAVQRPEKYAQFSQEVRVLSPALGPISFIAGAYYDNGHKEMNQNVDVPLFFASLKKNLAMNSNSWAVFGEVTWNVTDRFRAIFGSRYTSESQHARVTQIAGLFGTNLTVPHSVLPDFQIHEGHNTDRYTPSGTLQWEFTDHGQLYASYTQGFKTGGYDLDIPLTGPTNIENPLKADNWEYGDETATNYEVGAKLEIPDQAIRITGSLFHTIFKNLQIQSWDGTSGSSVLQNAASATAQGGELEVFWAPFEALSVDGNVGYTDSKYDSFVNGPCYQGQSLAQGCVGGQQNLSGKPLTLAPKITVSLNVDWHHQIAEGYDIHLGTNVSHRSSVILATDQEPGATQRALTLVDARVEIVPQDGMGTRLALIGRNIFDETYVTGSTTIISIPSAIALTVGQPGMIELQISHSF